MWAGWAELGWAWLGWGGLGWAGLRWGGLRWGGLGWAGLGWAGLGWAGLGCAGLVAKTRPRAYPSRQRNAAARRPQTSQKRTKTDAAWGPKTPHLNPVSKSLSQCFGKAHTKAWAGLGWAEFGLGTKNKAPEPRLQDSETQRHGGPNKPKT